MSRTWPGWLLGIRLAVLTVSLSLLPDPAPAQETGDGKPLRADTSPSLTVGQDNRPLAPSERYTVEPTRTAQQPQLDGVLDEVAW